MCPTFIGPYLVVEVLGSHLYRVEDRKKRMVLHQDKLKLCEDKVLPGWIQRRRRALLATISTSPKAQEESLGEIPFEEANEKKIWHL